VPYHLYYKVLNSKKHGVPQNRERIFLVGIRDDKDNDFSFPKEEHLKLRLKDVLENQVDEKYFLSDKMIECFTTHKEKHDNKGTGFGFKPKKEDDIANCIRANSALCPTDNTIIIGDLNKGGERGVVFAENSPIMSCLTATDYKQPKQILVKSNTIKGVPKTLDTQCNQGVMINKAEIQVMGNLKGEKGHNVQNYYSIEGISLTVMENHGSVTKIMMGGIIEQADIDNPLKGLTDYGWHFEQNVYSENSNITRTVMAGQGSGSRLKVIKDFRIRKLTPLECFRLQDFPDSHVQKCVDAGVSNSQLYKQAGNSITVRVLELIIRNLKL